MITGTIRYYISSLAVFAVATAGVLTVTVFDQMLGRMNLTSWPCLALAALGVISGVLATPDRPLIAPGLRTSTHHGIKT